MKPKESFPQQTPELHSRQIPDHIGEKIELKPPFAFSSKYPENITVGNQAFGFRHENPEQGNAVYINRIKEDSPIITENVIVSADGTIIDHLIYDERDSTVEYDQNEPEK